MHLFCHGPQLLPPIPRSLPTPNGLLTCSYWLLQLLFRGCPLFLILGIFFVGEMLTIEILKPSFILFPCLKFFPLTRCFLD